MTDILLIDDNRNFSLSLARNLQNAGFQVSVAGSGEEALQQVSEKRPGLIICDMVMPGKDGMAVKETLNRDAATADLPFIFLSAFSTSSLKSTGLLSGADDYITKPFYISELLARIQAVLRREERVEMRAQLEIQQILENLNSSLPLHTSHQFRTQLGILRLALDTALIDRKNSDLFIDDAITSAHKLRLITETLIWINEYDLGRCGSYYQQLNLDLYFHLPLREIQDIWKEKRLQLLTAVDDSLSIVAAPHSFVLAVSHLMDNACKFSPEGGSIQLQLEPFGLGGCLLTIRDQGSGIPASLREQVFERYYQVPNETEDPQNHGLGLGLFMARAFARLRGGDVYLLEEPPGCAVQMKLESI